MAKKSSIRRFARAVFELTGEEHMDDTKAELNKVAELGKDVVIVSYLDNPKINYNDKVTLLHERIGGLSKTVIHLVYLLIKKSQVNSLPEIADEYEHMVDEFNGIERAEIITAKPIDDNTRKNINIKLSNLIGKKVIIGTEKIDSELIGGIMIKVAGKLIDGSTRGRLTKLKKELI
ncbi:MAG: ATP synthase F1 subunit delta [Dehalococcoidia bacterium]|nr:MAG: ATP synthase F1 subunit delta [Dehalococcoidia bacterium]